MRLAHSLVDFLLRAVQSLASTSPSWLEVFRLVVVVFARVLLCALCMCVWWWWHGILHRVAVAGDVMFEGRGE